uniref:Uncharacterized protein n=1 Tax=Strigamia maritima TaxID=126957 RepID=T1IKA7_STRMM
MRFTLYKLGFSILSIFLFMMYIMTVHRNSFNAINTGKSNFEVKKQEPKNLNKRFIVDTPGCQIVHLEPFDPEVRKMYTYTENKECPEMNVFARANRTHLNIDMKLANEIHGNEVVCGYKRIWRDGNDTTDDSYGIADSLTNLTDSILAVEEFLSFECAINGEVFYQDFFPFIQVKPEVEKEHDLNFNYWMDETRETVVERLSVTFLGVDSISRLNMLRQMPKTFNYLRDVMDAIDLQGFTKVADNTFVNIVPMLSGLFLEECWNESLSGEPFDDLNLAWKDFAVKGYRTLFAEDFPEISIFNFLKAGFFHQPTDYYFRPFTLAVKDGINFTENCYNNRLEVNVVLKWLTDFLEQFR